MDARSLLSNPPELLQALFVAWPDIEAGKHVDLKTYMKWPAPPQRQVKLTGSQVEALIQKYKEGETINALAKSFGIHRTTVMRYLKTCGVQTRRNVRKLTDKQVQRAVEERALGASIASLARGLGVDPETLRQELSRRQPKN